MKVDYKVAGIYLISSTVSKKVYVGYSTLINKRWVEHKCNLRKNQHTNTHLQAAWNLYGEQTFTFSILEVLSYSLTKQEYEAIETKWVLYYNAHLREFGFNGCLPGSIPLYRQDENITKSVISTTEYVCINMNTKEVIEVNGTKEVSITTGIKSQSKITDLASHWEDKCKRKSLYGWIVVKKEIYDPEFDYINFKKHKSSSLIKKTWRDYPSKQYIKKSHEDIIPRKDRNLKRIPIVAININTGEELNYKMIKDCQEEFLLLKVRKCINAPFGKYKHRGYYFKRV